MKYLLKLPEQWDRELLAIAAVLTRPGQHVWDVGANVGLFSKAAAFHAGAAGEVLSIEADLDAVNLLNRTSRHRRPGHSEMTVLPVAVGPSTGFIRFAIARRARAANSIEGFGSTQTGGVREVRTLPCVTLDFLLQHFSPPDVLKIDVEGAELLLLQAAQQVLTTARPKIYCEVADKTRREVSHLLALHNYEVFDGRRFIAPSADIHTLSDDTSNLVAVPKERRSEIALPT